MLTQSVTSLRHSNKQAFRYKRLVNIVQQHHCLLIDWTEKNNLSWIAIRSRQTTFRGSLSPMCPHSLSSVNVNMVLSHWRTAYSTDIFSVNKMRTHTRPHLNCSIRQQQQQKQFALPWMCCLCFMISSSSPCCFLPCTASLLVMCSKSNHGKSWMWPIMKLNRPAWRSVLGIVFVLIAFQCVTED